MSIRKFNSIGYSIFFYLGVILSTLLAFAYIQILGTGLEPNILTSAVNSNTAVTGDSSWYAVFLHHLLKPPGLTLMQLILIMVTARFFAFLAHKIHQPGVIGEMVAGIFLGPSILGWFFPEYLAFVFPSSSLPILQSLSHLGLILFMFIIGMELDTGLVRTKSHSAMMISHMSIVVPFILGAILALKLYGAHSPPGVEFLSFSLFLGISMSITAFPVLARIIQERGLSGTPFGAIALTCAAIDDVTAWSLLAIIVAIVQAGSITHALLTLLLSLIFIIGMIFIVRPILARAASIYITHDTFTRSVMTYMIAVVFASALFTEVSGIHALFGAFLAGAIMPGGHKFKSQLTMRFEDLSLAALMPLFFALTGLRTSFSLITSPESIGILALIILIAITGKFGGSFIAARFSGMSWHESASIGILMNTRGLMELIVLNIGFDLGIIDKEIFTLMVLMTLVTTFMTGPLLALTDSIFGIKKRIIPLVPEPQTDAGLKLLLAFGPSRSGVRLLKLASWLAGAADPSSVKIDKVRITALHLSPSNYRAQQDSSKKKMIFQPILHTAEKTGLTVKTLYLQTPDVPRTICQVAREQNDDWIILGSAKALFNKSVIGGTVGKILKDAKKGVMVYIGHEIKIPKKVTVYYSGNDDESLLKITDNLLLHNQSKKIISVPDAKSEQSLIKEGYTKAAGYSFVRSESFPCINQEAGSRTGLLILSLSSYEKIIKNNPEITKELTGCSILILRLPPSV